MTTPIKVNFSSEEAASEVRGIMPTGEYVVNIVEGEIRFVKPGKKNSGKPFWFLKFIVQDGAYANYQAISSVMLFNEALYSLSQLMKALGYDINSGDFQVPNLDDIIGKTLIIKGTKKDEEKVDGRTLPERFEVKGFKPAKAGVKAATGKSSILP